MIHCLAPVMRFSTARGAQRAGVRAGLGLRQREGGQLVALGERRDVAADLLGRAVGQIGRVPALVCTATVTPTPASARESSSSTST